MTAVAIAPRSPAEAGERAGKRRHSLLGRVLMVVLTFGAINGLLGQIGSFRDIGAALARADWLWAVAALVGSILTFPASAIGVRAGLGTDLPLGPLTSLQLSSKFANLVTPAGLGSTALNVQFMRRQGVDATSAITSDVATSLVSGVAELLLAAVCLRWASERLHFGELPPGTGRTVLLVLLGIGVVVAIAARVPKVRAKVMPHLRRAWATAVGLVRSPRRTLLIAGSAALVSALFAICLGLSIRAYGVDVPFATLVVINWGATTLGSISPVPGGLGVAEAGLVAGLTAAGVPADVAVAGALTHRLVTFWLPPIAGWFALRSLRRQELL
jgi:glycosyltransferase 2 family protein